MLVDKVHPVGDVANPGRLIADLTLDHQRPGVADGLQGVEEAGDVHLALAQRHFLAPLAGGRRPAGVLEVDAADVRAEQLDGAIGSPMS